MTCIITYLDTTPLHFYRYLRKKGYTHRSAVTSVLMYYSPNKEDLYRRLKRRRRYTKAQAVLCTYCGRGTVGLFYCRCGKLICQDCIPPFGAMLINGRVLVCNYRTGAGMWVNGHVKDKSFITSEVEVRRDWPKGERGL